MIVRRATELDIEPWCEMRDRLWPDSAATNREEVENYFSSSSGDIRECFLVEDSGTAVGFIELNIRSYAEGSRCDEVPYVEGWFVEEKYRSKGLGRLLMDKAERWAQDNGYRELASDAEIDNNRSIAAHKKLGFMETDRIVCFLKRLKPLAGICCRACTL